jgi:UPF0755 protein
LKRLWFSLGLLAILIFGFVVWWKISLSPFSADKKTKTFIVEKGDGIKEVSVRLREANLVRSKIAFFLWERFFVKKTLQAGTFELSPSMDAPEIANRLTLGQEDVWITIPEGWRSEQILTLLNKTGDWKADEGKYFPETYRVPKDIDLEALRQLMLKTFSQKAPNITKDQLIVASLIEREAKNSTDRPLIASVVYNRLGAGMSLDIDATIQYALGVWKKDLTLEDLKIKSPYNTYINVGLPPSPICNPGLASIQAAISPAKSDYLFYIHDSSGTAHFAKTLDQHNANVAKYL